MTIIHVLQPSCRVLLHTTPHRSNRRHTSHPRALANGMDTILGISIAFCGRSGRICHVGDVGSVSGLDGVNAIGGTERVSVSIVDIADTAETAGIT